MGQQDKEMDRLSGDVRAAIRALDRAGLRPRRERRLDADDPQGARDRRAHRGASRHLRYNDRLTAEAGACDWDDCALTVLATVVSTAVPGQAVIDAGAKALGRDRPAKPEDGFAP